MNETKAIYQRACSLLRSRYSLPNYNETRDKYLRREIFVTRYGLMVIERDNPAILKAAEHSILMANARGIGR